MRARRALAPVGAAETGDLFLDLELLPLERGQLEIVRRRPSGRLLDLPLEGLVLLTQMRDVRRQVHAGLLC